MMRPGSSGFSAVGSQKPPRTERAQPLWATCSAGGNVCPYIKPSLPFSRLSKPSCLTLFSVTCISPWPSRWLTTEPHPLIHILLVLVGTKQHTALRMSLRSAVTRGIIPFLHLLAMTLSIWPTAVRFKGCQVLRLEAQHCPCSWLLTRAGNPLLRLGDAAFYESKAGLHRQPPTSAHNRKCIFEVTRMLCSLPSLSTHHRKALGKRPPNRWDTTMFTKGLFTGKVLPLSCQVWQHLQFSQIQRAWLHLLW